MKFPFIIITFFYLIIFPSYAQKNEEYKIKKIKRKKSTYIIYAQRNDSTFKIISDKNEVPISYMCEKIRKGKSYPLELKKIFPLDSIDGIPLIPNLGIRGRQLENGVVIYIERKSHYRLYFANNLIGLCINSISHDSTNTEISTNKLENIEKYNYEQAFKDLSLPDITFKEGVFIVEAAYYDGYLDYEAYNAQLRFYARLCNEMSKNTSLFYEETDYVSVLKHASLFKLMTDTIPIQIDDSIVISHLPFEYNFEDYAGKKDWNNMFVTTLLETRKGNCHSLPILYKLIAEEMGEKAWLALAPNHMYIKLQNKQSGWYNTELTSGNFPTDPYIKSSGYIHLDAIQNGIYMDTLSQKESIGLCMVDLALGYKNKYPDTYDPLFVLKCCDKALEYFPDFINALLLQASTRYKMYQDKSLKEEKELKEIEALYTYIHNLGYRKMPEDMYLKWLDSLKAFDN